MELIIWSQTAFIYLKSADFTIFKTYWALKVSFKEEEEEEEESQVEWMF